MLNLASLLELSTRSHPEKTALVASESRMSFRELNEAATRLAASLRLLGVQQGQQVALLLPNVPAFPIAYYAILKAGAVVVPLNVMLKRAEIQYHLEDSDAVALIAWEGFLEEALPGYQAAPFCTRLIVARALGAEAALPSDALVLDALVAAGDPAFDTAQTSPDDTAVILYTSGTTGRSKGAELSHFNMFSNAITSADRIFLIKESDTVLSVLPLFHSFGQTCVLNAGLYAGATVTMLPRFEPTKAFETMVRDRVTVFMGVPTMYFYLLNHPEADSFDLSSLRCCVSGGASMPVEVMLAFNKKYNVVVQEGYGLSETAPVASFNLPDRPPKPGSIGTQVWGVEVRVVDAEGQPLPPGELGEIVIRGQNVMKGYYKRPDATDEAIRGGWFYTGDLGQMDEDGFLFIVDRIKDMLIRGGYNVYPREIEEILYGHAAVAEAAVVGMPDQVWGEEVKAVVALKPGQQASERELIDYCKERLASFKYPRSVEFRESLPKTATGKILKRELR